MRIQGEEENEGKHGEGKKEEKDEDQEFQVKYIINM